MTKYDRLEQDALRQVSTGTIAIQEFSKLATAGDANDPTLSMMAVSALNGIRQAQTETEQAQVLAVAMLAAYVYGQGRGVRVTRTPANGVEA